MKLTKNQKQFLSYCSGNGVEAITSGQTRTAKSLERKGLIRISINELNQKICQAI